MSSENTKETHQLGRSLCVIEPPISDNPALTTHHEQVMIRINALCDRGIAPLVGALNEIDGVITVDSCENGAWGAYVFFHYGEDWRDLATLLQEISSLLSDPGLPCGYSLQLEWLGSNNRPRALISLEPEHMALVAEGIGSIASILNDRMCALGGDR